MPWSKMDEVQIYLLLFQTIIIAVSKFFKYSRNFYFIDTQLQIQLSPLMIILFLTNGFNSR